MEREKERQRERGKERKREKVTAQEECHREEKRLRLVDGTGERYSWDS